MASSSSASIQVLNRMYREAGVPGTILDKHHTSWTMEQIRDILHFYGVGGRVVAASTNLTKLELMRRLAPLVEERGLTRFDRLEIARYSRGGGGRAGGPRPPQKPVVLRTTASGGNHDTRILAEVKQSPPTTPSNDETAQQLAQPTWSTNEPPEAVSARDVTGAEASNPPCAVCFEDLSTQTSPDRKITNSCSHELDVCRPCLSRSISTQFTSKVWNQIDCPTCGERLDFHDVKDFAESEIFER